MSLQTDKFYGKERTFSLLRNFFLPRENFLQRQLTFYWGLCNKLDDGDTTVNKVGPWLQKSYSKQLEKDMQKTDHMIISLLGTVPGTEQACKQCLSCG